MNAEAIKTFGEQPDLETLQIHNYRDLNDAMVEELKGLKNLKNLALANSGITNAAVKTIAESFPNLTSLDLSKSAKLTDGALKSIATLKELETLVINYCGFGEFGMMDIASLPKLKTLDIRANMTVGNTGLEFLAKIPMLRSLKHRSPAVDDYGLEALTAAPEMESLLLQDCNITDSAGQLLKKFEKMKELEIFRCQGFGSVGTLELKGMPLVRLTLRDLPSVDDSGMDVFRELPTLKRLYLNELPSVSDAGLTALLFLKELEVLDIWAIAITDKSLETIAKLPNVKELSIRSTNISDAGVDSLLSMPKLTSLTLKDNANLTDAGRRRLVEKGYKKLDFGNAVPSEE
jgi:Leucine-rich repeat (LRR) protein